MNGEFRLRFAYAKAGRLRFLSHLEVLRALERLTRRSGLAYAVTQGFSPHMKIAFGPALPVGTGGQREYADIWLTRYTKSEEALERLQRVAPDDLAPFQASYVPERAPSLTAALTIAKYQVELSGKEIGPTEAQAAIRRLLDVGELEVEHKGKKKVFDLARCVPEDARAEMRDGRLAVELTVKMGPQGSLRPEVFLRAALAESGISVPVMRTTRTDLLVEDDKGVWSSPM